MNTRMVIDRCARNAVVCVLALGAAVSALADAGSSARRATIMVFADHYVAGGLAFDDLDYLERHVAATQYNGVELLVCGTRGTRALKAAVHRFRHVPVEMRVPDADERRCMSAAPFVTPVRQRTGQRPFGIDDEAVEQYWLDIMP